METSIDDICFVKAYNERNFIGYADSLVSYDKAIDGAVKLADDLPIFLDTNVLLRVYEISLASRIDLLKFLEKIKVKAVITLQVQREFIKNRQHIIDTFRDTTFPGINVKFLSEVENRISDYFKANKKYLDDLPEFSKKLDSVISEVEATKSILKEELARAGEQLQITNEDDPLMQIMRGMEMVTMLTDSEILLLKSKFDILRNAIPPNEKGQQKKTINRALYAFPGAGDIDDKELDPYGDYIIFHEMVRFVKNKKTNVLFLTYDTEKGDWMDKDKKPFSHYIQVVHSITGHNIFFINAERFFEDYLDESFTSLVPDEKMGIDVSQESRILFVVKFMRLEKEVRRLSRKHGVEGTLPFRRMVVELSNYLDYSNTTIDELQLLERLRNTFSHGLEDTFDPNLEIFKDSNIKIFLTKLDYYIQTFNDINDVDGLFRTE